LIEYSNPPRIKHALLESQPFSSIIFPFKYPFAGGSQPAIFDFQMAYTLWQFNIVMEIGPFVDDSFYKNRHFS